MTLEAHAGLSDATAFIVAVTLITDAPFRVRATPTPPHPLVLITGTLERGAESLSRAGERQVGLMSVWGTQKEGFNRVRMPESSVLMGAGNTWVLGSRCGNALTWFQSWRRVWKSLSPGFKRMPWS